jgi:glyoxylase-like metal-dependent hydrolase (beta-lactamase superfamily II)
MNFVGGGGSTTIGPGNFNQSITPQLADTSQNWTSNSVELYITPWGFLKGAAASNTTVSKRKLDGKNYTVLTWSPAKKADSLKSYVINGYVNEKNIVDRVETWLPDNIMGDMHVLAVYSDWKDFGGVMAPAKIVQTRGGFPYFEVTVTAAKANPPDLATLAVPPPAPARGGGGGAPPANAAGGPPRGAPPAGGAPPLPAAGAPAAARGGAPAAPAPMVVTSEKLGDGLYRLTTGAGSYDSMIVEFKTYIMMLEAGQGTPQSPDGRALAYIAEAKKLIPNKPIRYVMNTHPHADHTGGLPTMVAEGAIIITQKNNEDFLEKSLNTPRTLLTDTLAKNPKKAKFETVDEKKVYSDGTRTVEMYHIPGAPHSNGLIIAYIPKEKVLFQGDFSLPTMPGEEANDHIKALVPVLEKLNLDFNRYINVHASPAPQFKAELWKAVGK